MPFDMTRPVSGGNPMPVTSSFDASGIAPVAGTLSATGQTASFTPQLGRPIWLTLSGAWAGTVTLERSVDGGTTWLPATLAGTALTYTANLNEPVTEESVGGAIYRGNFTRTSGDLTYRIEQ